MAGVTVLTINCGSSSLKFGLYAVGSGACAPLLTGEFEAIGERRGRLSASAPGERRLSETGCTRGPAQAIARIARLIAEWSAPAPAVVGHRIVHGGCVRDHTVIDPAIMRGLEAAVSFAPLHAPAALSAIGAAREDFEPVPQVACLDTAFHRTMPEVARRFALPDEPGIERYGFHGLSCESIVRHLGADLPERLVVAHLGAGSSITAVLAGRSIDTSMGLTPTGGIMMGTRSGDLDPGLLIFLMRKQNLDADALEALVDRRSGLLGVSGLSSDMRKLRKAMRAMPRARLAVEMFAYSARKEIAAMAAALGGLDLLVFTGGIGEHDAKTRAAICNYPAWVSPRVRVVASQENEQIALHCFALVADAAPSGSATNEQSR